MLIKVDVTNMNSLSLDIKLKMDVKESINRENIAKINKRFIPINHV